MHVDHVGAERGEHRAPHAALQAASPWSSTVDECTNKSSVCSGCHQALADALEPILHVDAEHYWHAACLKCAKCGDGMAAATTCMMKHGAVYCKQCYNW